MKENLKKAFIAIKKLKEEVKQLKESQQNTSTQTNLNEPIAVIGMACRFPGGVNSPEDYWKLLINKKDAIAEVPKDRWDVNKYYDPEPGKEGKSYVKKGGYIDRPYSFDSSFFGISPIEAEAMDPQHRVLLEVSYEAIERAGLDINKLKGSQTGVFVGSWDGGYSHQQLASHNLDKLNTYTALGGTSYPLAGRISYSFGFEGPAIQTDTACSTSLVTIHLACQSLRSGESDIALAGGVNLILSPTWHVAFCNMNALSPSGHCHAFSNQADGFVRSEGCGVLVLKNLSDAKRDGDNILGIIKGSSVNQDGRSNGFAAPSSKAQEKLIKVALENSQLKPEDITYIETHGTGTALGDPIEVEGITNAILKKDYRKDNLVLGAVKSNIGHTETAAGVAGVIKVLLAMQHKKIPANIYFESPNEYINWDKSIKIPTDTFEWNPQIGSRYAGVSGFGISGTNAHVILEEYADHNKADVTPEEESLFVLPISAKSQNSLKNFAEKYITFLKNADFNLYDICASAAFKRTHFDYRLAVVGQTKEEIIESLSDFVELYEEDEEMKPALNQHKIVFVFPGQGSQWVGMGKELYENNEVFSKAFDACDSAFQKYINWSLKDEMYAIESESQLHIADRLQPSICAFQIALIAVWKSYGVIPDAVVGHSMGEIAAAYSAEILTLDEAAKIICTRSQLMKRMSGKGGMLLTNLSIKEAEELLSNYNGLSLAVINDPNTNVIGGDLNSIENLEKDLQGKNIFCKKVKMDVAAHTSQMDDMLPELRQGLADLQPNDNGKIKYYSAVLGELLKGSSLVAEYWVKNVRQTVQFSATLDAIINDSYNTFIEISPHAVLKQSINNCLSAKKKTALIIHSLKKDKPEKHEFLNNLTELYSTGFDFEWNTIFNSSFRFPPLPVYPWIQEDFNLSLPEINSADPFELNNLDEEKLLCEIKWEEIDGEFRQNSTVNANELWISFSNDIQNYSYLKEIFLDKKVKLINVTINKSLNESNNLHSSEEAEILSVLKDIKANENKPISGIVHSLGLENASFGSDLKSDELINLQSSECILIKNTIKALMNLNQSDNTKICILTSGCHKVISNDNITNGISSVLWGFSRTIRNEHPEFNCISVDLENDYSQEDLVNVSSIFLDYGNNQTEIAIRKSKIYSARIEQFNTLNFQSLRKPFGLNTEGTYILTGGYGGFGIEITKWLINHGVKNIVLLGRKGVLPEGSKIIFNEFIEAGVNIHVFKCDVSIEKEVEETIEKIKDLLPTIKGVFHLAGIIRDSSILNMSDQSFYEVLNPKVKGAWNLHKHTLKEELDCFVLFSSIASLIGNVGQGNYVAANCFLDSLAHYRSSLGLTSKTINLGAVSDSGMAANKKDLSEKLEAIGLKGMPANTYTQLLEKIFDSDLPQIGIANINFDTWRDIYTSASKNKYFERVFSSTNLNVEIKEKESLIDRFKKLETREEKINILENFVKNITAKTLKYSPKKINLEAQFKQLGVDSLITVQLRNRFSEELKIPLNVTSVFAYPTLKKYAGFLFDQIEKEFIDEKKNMVELKEVNEDVESLETLSLDELSNLLEQEL